jgi:hypothetical protein
MATMLTFRMKGKEVGTVDDEGIGSNPAIEALIEPRRAAGWTPETIAEFYDGWGNGYLSAERA